VDWEARAKMSEIRASKADMVFRWVFNLLPEDAELVIERILLLGFPWNEIDWREREGISMFTLEIELNWIWISVWFLLYWVSPGGYGFPGTVYIGPIAGSDIFLHYNFVTTFFALHFLLLLLQTLVLVLKTMLLYHTRSLIIINKKLFLSSLKK
jgi:hypothetical protein